MQKDLKLSATSTRILNCLDDMPLTHKLNRFTFLDELNARKFADKANPKAFAKIEVSYDEKEKVWVVGMLEEVKSRKRKV